MSAIWASSTIDGGTDRATRLIPRMACWWSTVGPPVAIDRLSIPVYIGLAAARLGSA